MTQRLTERIPICIVSGGPKAGKMTAAVGTALEYAKNGESVMFIDTNPDAAPLARLVLHRAQAAGIPMPQTGVYFASTGTLESGLAEFKPKVVVCTVEASATQKLPFWLALHEKHGCEFILLEQAARTPSE